MAIIIYVGMYNQRKKRYEEEKKLLEERFAHELLTSQVETREQILRTVGAELHDNVGQILSLTALTLSFMDLDNRHDSADKLQTVEGLVKRSVSELRQLSQLLYGENLLNDGLAHAIGMELDWLARTGAYTIKYERPENPGWIVSKEKETILFRVFQELLNNIVKHAGASLIIVNVENYLNGLKLTVEDNGAGFDQELVHGKGLGLSTLKRRAALIGGDVFIDSAPGASTRISISLQP